MDKLNVHCYDGDMDLYHSNTVVDDKLLHKPKEYTTYLAEVLEETNKLCSNNEKNTINLVIKKINTDKNGNIDAINKTSFEDVFVRTWRFYRLCDNNMKKIFLEQIHDISSGFCPQGRAGARLIQLYNIWMNYVEMYSKDQNSTNLDKDVVDVVVQILK